MEGETTKYYRYEKTSGRVLIPLSIAKALGWKHKDELTVIFKEVEGKSGLFIFKKED